METVSCIICENNNTKKLFEKASRDGERFQLVQCRSCGLQYINPRPGENDIGKYYGAEYFTRRTERGYNNYFSPELKREIERVFTLNLEDLGFFEFEQELDGEKRSLDIGCAAGYFVGFMKDRGWDARGIDISRECVEFARGGGLNVTRGDYLDTAFDGPFDVITLWASIEHLHHPHLFLEKISRELAPDGRLYISTCRAGGLNFMKFFGSAWRFYNFPEHLYYFSRSSMKRILDKNGFSILTGETYGSGAGKPGSWLRKLADFAAKRFGMGDMMILAAKKKRHNSF